jgi:ATP-dependent DNA helicase 2 subunit 2
MKMEDTFSPVLHRIDQAVRWRAIHPDKPIPPPYEILTRYSKPPGKLLDAAKPDLAKLITTAAVKQGQYGLVQHKVLVLPLTVASVPPKVMSRKRVHEQSKPISGLDVDALLGREKRAKISPDNAIPEFRQMLNSVEDPSGIQAAAAEFGSIINERIINSIGDDKYAQAVAELTVLRQEMLELEEPEVWNEYVRRLKGKLIGDGLGGGRDEIWWQMRKARLGLITPKELGGEASKVTDEEARLFLLAK